MSADSRGFDRMEGGGALVLLSVSVASAEDPTKPVLIISHDQQALFVPGFVIAEKDLELRGPGEFLGQRQSGMPEFVLADLAAHRDLLSLARNEAGWILEQNDQNHINLLLSLFERDSAVKFLASG